MELQLAAAHEEHGEQKCERARWMPAPKAVEIISTGPSNEIFTGFDTIGLALPRSGPEQTSRPSFARNVENVAAGLECGRWHEYVGDLYSGRVQGALHKGEDQWTSDCGTRRARRAEVRAS